MIGLSFLFSEEMSGNNENEASSEEMAKTGSEDDCDHGNSRGNTSDNDSINDCDCDFEQNSALRYLAKEESLCMHEERGVLPFGSLPFGSYCCADAFKEMAQAEGEWSKPEYVAYRSLSAAEWKKVEVASVMDPRCKMKYLEYSLSKQGGGDGISDATTVLAAVRTIFNGYVTRLPEVLKTTGIWCIEKNFQGISKLVKT
ncbi:hypothetical protein Tsubulata_003047 [Turnera subulata]|uniref:Uncharacterized protein n=1 Tax=Turnera subulata TaxID=218843 RepID=A0A9Q0JIB9_9ROSI|nr:hypothetical protein Tsubulata_003047 [Turnera subulata]